MSCPMDVEGSRVWFTDLWNYSIIPYMLEAVREGLQVTHTHTHTHTHTKLCVCVKLKRKLTDFSLAKEQQIRFLLVVQVWDLNFLAVTKKHVNKQT